MFSSQRRRGTTTWERDRTSPPTTPWGSGEVSLNLDDEESSGFDNMGFHDGKQEPGMEFGRLRTGEQRKKHNAIERRRKKAIKEAMQELLDLMPDKQTKPTQLTILRAAVDHIRDLKQENEELRAQTGYDGEDAYSSGSRSFLRGKRRRKGSRGDRGSVSDEENGGPGVDCSSPIYSASHSFAGTPTDEIEANARGGSTYSASSNFVSIHDRVIADSITASTEMLGAAPASNTMSACITEALLSQLPDDAFSHESLTASSSSQASTMSNAEDDIEEVIAQFLIHND